MQKAKKTVELDNEYLHLLPQPNTNKLAKKIKDLIGGEVYLDGNSTRHSFRTNAARHKVIHIATHALYNNTHPGRSGLIFAKNMTDADDSNFLSLYDIYNCDLSSDLTLLTACETGRASYSDGEGMVSLAHAFNYAGSRHILTALWQIDEQSSNQITESFITHLRNGEATDIALQQAKIEYLGQARGRMLAPSYWGGLILMGNASHVSLHKTAYSGSWWTWLILISFFVITVVYYFHQKITSTDTRRKRATGPLP